ncbi:MAG: LysE family translocator [Rhodospirillales bacterium]|nr:LysE family translocator [Rhodospirillales bacterium]
MSLELYLAFIAACVVVAAVPGPMVALVVANSLTHGARAGLANVAGAQLGLAIMLGTLVVGLATVVATMGAWFDWLRLVGAADLVWIGVKMLRAGGGGLAPGAVAAPRGGFFLQGLLVMLSNPKVLLFFGAFIPQFVDSGGDRATQVVVLGATAMAVAALSDGAYALLAARAARTLSRRRARALTTAGGAMLIGGGIWMALARPR